MLIKTYNGFSDRKEVSVPAKCKVCGRTLKKSSSEAKHDVCNKCQKSRRY